MIMILVNERQAPPEQVCVGSFGYAPRFGKVQELARKTLLAYYDSSLLPFLGSVIDDLDLAKLNAIPLSHLATWVATPN